MANPLTGDFDAVLQVSGSTVNRLLASIHQNGGTKTTLPGFTHGTRLRVGDPTPIDGMRGTIEFQVSVPHIDLIHGVTDRFWLDVGVRARYRADPGSVPVPEFIHGIVRAQYRIDPIDPSCWGWEKLAAQYLWIRVIPDTVSFTGTAVDDDLDFSVLAAGMDPAVADARITRLARVLLKVRFEATPHKVSKRFRKGSMRSLHVGANRSVVAVPLGLTGDPIAGQIESINQDLLDGRDFGIAISRDVILAKAQHELDALRASFSMGLRVLPPDLPRPRPIRRRRRPRGDDRLHDQAEERKRAMARRDGTDARFDRAGRSAGDHAQGGSAHPRPAVQL